MRVAIVHYWLLGMRGGERALEQICRLFPGAHLYTHVLDRAAISEALLAHPITTTRIARLPFARRLYQAYLGFMPAALEALDLSGYDLVISSESGPAKGVIPAPTARHICYCHSPMRYIWDQYNFYLSGLNPIKRAVFARLAHRLRIWDVTSAARVDQFAANSSFVAARIQRYYRREAEVIPPPVATTFFSSSPIRGDVYLFVSELVAYKRADIVVDAFRDLDRRVIIVGDGAELPALRRRAGRNVTFRGRVSNEELRALYGECRAVLFPGEEDFGIVPVEAMASGRPVIAYGRGGALDTVAPGKSGLLFGEQTPEALREAIARFEASARDFNPAAIAAHAERFSEARFREGFSGLVERVMGRRPARPALHEVAR